MSWEIREFDPVAEPAILNSVVSLRVRCWAAQTPVPLTREDLVDSFEYSARHWIAVAKELVIGAARLSIHGRLEDVPEADCLHGVYSSPPVPIGFLSRLVVAPEYRRLGVRRHLDEIRIRTAEAVGCQCLLALVFEPSGASRVSQLTSQGFTVRGLGCVDTHPKFSVLPPPLVVERLICPVRS